MYLKPEKGTPFVQNLPVKAIIGVPPGGMKILASLNCYMLLTSCIFLQSVTIDLIHGAPHLCTR